MSQASAGGRGSAEFYDQAIRQLTKLRIFCDINVFSTMKRETLIDLDKPTSADEEEDLGEGFEYSVTEKFTREEMLEFEKCQKSISGSELHPRVDPKVPIREDCGVLIVCDCARDAAVHSLREESGC